MVADKAARSPRGFVCFRPGQVTLSLRPRVAGTTPPLTASDLAALEQVIEGKPGVPAGTRFPANVLQLADTERQAQTSAVGLRSNIIAARQRQGARLTHVISTINLAGWTSDLNQSTNASDLLDPIGEVAAIVKALTKAIDESVNGRLSLDHEGVISAYDLVAAAPNWIAGST